MGPDQLDQTLHLVDPADEGRDINREVTRRRVECHRRRELGPQALRADLEQMLRPGQVAQPVHPQVDQIGPVGQPGRHGTQHDLSPMRSGHHPGRPVEDRTEIVTITLGRLTSVNTHSHPHHRSIRPSLSRQSRLSVDRGAQRIRGRGEGRGEAVPGGGKHIAAVPLDRHPHDSVMARHRHPHSLRIGLPAPRGALDVGEEKRHRPRRTLRHKTPPVDQPSIPESTGPRRYRSYRKVWQ